MYTNYCNIWLRQSILPGFIATWNDRLDRLVIKRDRNKGILGLIKNLERQYLYSPYLCFTGSWNDFSMPSRRFCKDRCDFRFFTKNEITIIATKIYDYMDNAATKQAQWASIFYRNCVKRNKNITISFDGDIPAMIFRKPPRSTRLKPCRPNECNDNMDWPQIHLYPNLTNGKGIVMFPPCRN